MLSQPLYPAFSDHNTLLELSSVSLPKRILDEKYENTKIVTYDPAVIEPCLRYIDFHVLLTKKETFHKYATPSDM